MSPKPAALAKTTRPRLAGILPRPRLFRLLDRARTRPILWVSGLPGAGKTTLVASYLHARRLRSLWYQVDEGDADVATLFFYMGAAAAKAAPRRRAPLPLLTPEHLPGLATFTRRYFRDLYSRLKAPFVLVFDNYHEVPADSPFHEVIRNGVAELPEGGRIVLISRGEPPEALARLRASPGLARLGWEELRLTAEETRRLARQRWPAGASPERLRVLHDTTEGWAAGLVLLLEGLKTEAFEAPAVCPLALEGLFDYFAQEIFERLDADTQRVLLETAFLPRLTAAMAEQLTGSARAGRILADLTRRNYFTSRRAHAEPLYEYHPLFRRFLLARAAETLAQERRVQVQRTAAAVLEASGQVEDAVGLLREAGEWTELARVIGQHAPSLVAQGRERTLEGWLTSLPRAFLEQMPWLRYWLGVSRLPFNPTEARPHLERAFEQFQAASDPTGQFVAWVGVVWAIIIGRDDFTPLDGWIATLDDLMKRHPNFPTRELEGRVAAVMFGAISFRQPQHPSVTFWEERLRGLLHDAANRSQRLRAGANLLRYYAWIGDAARAAWMIDTLRPLARSPEIAPAAQLDWWFAEVACYLLLRNEPRYLEEVREALGAARATGLHPDLVDTLLHALAVHSALISGDHAAAAASLREMASVTQQRSHPQDVGLYHNLSAWEALSRDDFSRAAEHARTALTQFREAGLPIGQASAHIGLAQALFGRGDDREAAAHLAEARDIGRGLHSLPIEYLSLRCEAQFALDRGDEPQGLACLREALALSRHHGFVPALVVATDRHGTALCQSAGGGHRGGVRAAPGAYPPLAARRAGRDTRPLALGDQDRDARALRRTGRRPAGHLHRQGPAPAARPAQGPRRVRRPRRARGPPHRGAVARRRGGCRLPGPRHDPPPSAPPAGPRGSPPAPGGAGESGRPVLLGRYLGPRAPPHAGRGREEARADG